VNASDDNTEPLGESPAIDLWAIERGSVLGLLSAADKILATKQLAERQGQALKEIRELATHWRTVPTQPALMQAGNRLGAILDRLGA
jgi:hypothetical protein